MAAIETTRVKDIPTTATTAAADDYVLLDGATNGTRKGLASNLITATVVAAVAGLHAEPKSLGKVSVALSTLATAGTSLVHVGAFGDSLGSTKAIPIGVNLQIKYGDGGHCGYFGAETGFYPYALTGGAADIDGVSFTDSPVGKYLEFPAGGVAEFGTTNPQPNFWPYGDVVRTWLTAYRRVDTIKVYSLKRSGGGVFKVQISLYGSEDTYADVTGMTAIDTSGANTSILVSSATIALSNVARIRIVGVSGTSRILGGGCINSHGGVVLHQWHVGGMDMLDFQGSPLVAELVATVAPHLVLWSAQDTQATLAASLVAFTSLFTDASFSFFGCNNSSAVEFDACGYNKIVSDHCSAIGAYYFSPTWILGSYANAVACGWMADEVHPNPKAGATMMSYWLSASGLLDNTIADKGAMGPGGKLQSPSYSPTPFTSESDLLIKAASSASSNFDVGMVFQRTLDNKEKLMIGCRNNGTLFAGGDPGYEGYYIDAIGDYVGALRPVIFRTSIDAGVTRQSVCGIGANGLSLSRTWPGVNGQSLGGASIGIFLENASPVPSTNPTDGVILYSEGGHLKCRNAFGTVVTLN